MILNNYLANLPSEFIKYEGLPWNFLIVLQDRIREILSGREIYISPNAIVEQNVTLKPPIYISDNCFVASGNYLRGGVYLDTGVTIGPGCEIKNSYIGKNSGIAHFNLVGDSLIGQNVNFEAGAVTANQWNDRECKDIFINLDGLKIFSGMQKLGSIIGDNSKIGANSVLAPGTILKPNSIVPRLTYLNQDDA